MKLKLLSSLLVLLMLLPYAAEAAGLNEFDKSSYSDYLGDNLTCTEEMLLTFGEDISFGGAARKSKDEGIDGGACLKGRSGKDNGSWQLINTPADSFHINMTDKFKQTVKMWVYVNDIDLLGCDHDSVYDKPQDGSGTLWITLSSKKGGVGHTWQHTFYGDGWHEIELAFDCHNVGYDALDDIDYSNLTSLKVWGIAKKGLEIRFDDMRLCTYDNPNYTAPEAPYGGVWLSTCDYDALDGVILTEWYGACFDLENKTQGSSSVTLTGHKENVDHRVCIGVNDVIADYDEDTLCFDMYISDPELLGENWQIRLEHNAQAAHYALDYATAISGLVDEKMKRTYLKSGWNHFQIPLDDTDIKIGAGYEDTFTDDLSLTQLVFFIEGTGKTEDENYIIKYDNFYLAKTETLKEAKAQIRAAETTEAAEETAPPSYTAAPEETVAPSCTEPPSEESSAVLPIILAAGIIAVICVAAVIIIKKKK